MRLELYDLAASDPERRFSPYCWRTKLALMHKGLAFDTIPWRFTDKDAIASSGQGRVPVLIDGDLVLFNSWTIATYLEEVYADRPSLFGGEGGRAAARFINGWADSVLVGGIVRLVVNDIFAHLDEKDRNYFRASREKRFGMKLEDISADRDARVVGFRDSLEPIRILLRAQPFFGGDAPNYADYIVFGPFQWARSISDFRLLAHDDIILPWRDRLLDAFSGFARRAPAYPS